MRILKAVALFMMILIVSLPVTFALSINSYRLAGRDGVANYVRPTDTINLTAEVGGVGDISPAVVAQMLRAGNIPFSSCQPDMAGGMICTFSKQFTNNGRTVFTYTLSLTDEEGVLQDRESGVYYVDAVSPQVHINNVRQTGSNITASVSLRDYAFLENDTSSCAGLKRVALVSQGGSEITSLQLSGCSQDTSLSFNASLLGTTNVFSATASSTVCVQVYDAFAQQGSDCFSFTPDLQKPVVNTAVLRGTNGESLQYIGDVSQGRLYFTVSENRGQPSVIIQKGEERIDAYCSDINNGLYNCTTGDIAVSPGPQTFIFSAQDAAGNIAEKSQTFTLTKDEVAPVFDAVVTAATKDDMPVIAPNHSISLRFTEQESGFYGNNVELLINDQTQSAPTCVKATQWVCTWNTPRMSGHGTQHIYFRAIDDAGNQVGDEGGLEVFVDSRAPVLTGFDSYSFIEGMRIPYAYSLGTYIIEFNYTDDLPVSASVDLTDLGGGEITQQCESGTCVLQAIMGDGPATERVAINISDEAGNTLQYYKTIELLHTSNSSAVYWNFSAFTIPTAIDRTAAELIRTNAYTEITLDTHARAELLGVDLDSCISRSISEANTIDEEFNDDEGDDGGIIETNTLPDAGDEEEGAGDSGFIRSYSLVDQSSNATTQYIKLGLKSVSYAEIDSINLTCYLRLISKAPGLNGGLLSFNETKEIPVNIAFYNNPAGDLGSTYQKELEDAIEDANDGILNKIAQLEKYVSIARKICDIAGTIMGILSAIDVILFVMDITSDGLLTNTFTYSAGSGMKQGPVYAWCQGSEAYAGAVGGFWENYGKKFCGFVNCQVEGMLIGAIGGEGVADTVYSFTGGGIADSLGGGAAGNYTFINAQDSIVWSVITLCIPGIIKNLNEYRQIKCRYALCLQDDVPAGIPKESCDALKSYQECKYIWGEIFSIFPLANFFNMIMDKIKQILSSPTAIIGAMVSLLCYNTCHTNKIPVIGSGLPAKVCKANRLLQAAGEIWAAIDAMTGEDYWELQGDDVCEELDD